MADRNWLWQTSSKRNKGLSKFVYSIALSYLNLIERISPEAMCNEAEVYERKQDWNAHETLVFIFKTK